MSSFVSLGSGLSGRSSEVFIRITLSLLSSISELLNDVGVVSEGEGVWHSKVTTEANRGLGVNERGEGER
jgi:hypothetical protein